MSGERDRFGTSVEMDDASESLHRPTADRSLRRGSFRVRVPDALEAGSRADVRNGPRHVPPVCWGEPLSRPVPLTQFMRQAIVEIRDEDFAGSEEVISVFRGAGLVDVEVLSCDWTGGTVRVRVEEELDERRLDEADSVEWWERVGTPGSGYVYLVEMTSTETSGPEISETDDLLPVGFIEIDERGVTFDVSGSQEGIREVIAGFREAGTNVTLKGLHEYRSRGRPLESLTERQREVLRVAFEGGYYDVPRGTTTKELALELDVDGSTVSEHLQRAERNLVSTVLND